VRERKSRTPDEELYEVEHIKDRKLENGHPVYLIQWQGYEDEKHDTWEPLSNLAGIKPDVAAYQAKQSKDALDFAAELRAKQKAKVHKDKVMVAGSSTSSTTTWQSVIEDLEGEEGPSSAAEGSNGKKSAPIWKRYKLDASADAKPKHYICQEMFGQGAKHELHH
jgi:hypothetical protein